MLFKNIVQEYCSRTNFLHAFDTWHLSWITFIWMGFSHDGFLIGLDLCPFWSPRYTYNTLPIQN